MQNCNERLLVFDALLAGNCLAGALPGAGIRAGSLAANGQPATMTQPAVTGDVTQSGNVLLHFSPQLPLDQVLFIEQVGDTGDIVIAHLAGLALQIETQGAADANGRRAS